MNLLALRYFCEVARCGNVTEVSRRLHVSQPAVSKSIHGLEAELNCTLLTHTSAGMKLTEKGELFYEKASAALDLLDEGQRLIAPSPLESVKTLRIVSFVRFDFLPELYLAFQKQYPEISLEIRHATYRTILKEHEYDVAILPDSCLSSHQDSVFLLEDEFMLAVPSTHPLTDRDQVALEEVKNEPFVAMDLNFPARQYLEKICRQAGFQPVITMECDEFSTYARFVQAGYGLSLVSTLSSLRLTDQVRFLHISSPRCSRMIYLAWPSSRSGYRAPRIFVNFCQNYVKQFL